MSYEEVALEDMVWDKELSAYTYECPCGDLFQITLDELKAGEEIARCPSCSLFITVVYDPVRPAGYIKPPIPLCSRTRDGSADTKPFLRIGGGERARSRSRVRERKNTIRDYIAFHTRIVGLVLKYVVSAVAPKPAGG
eukprot:3902050-Pyramimonas_sp.AAC.1